MICKCFSAERKRIAEFRSKFKILVWKKDFGLWSFLYGRINYFLFQTLMIHKYMYNYIPKNNLVINLYQFILLMYIIATWLLNFNIINSSNRFVYSIMEAMYRLCEPSLKLVRRYIPNFGTIDISPIVVYLGLWFIKSLLIEYWPRWYDYSN